MKSAPMHPDESARLVQLHALGLLDADPDEAFDRITRLAQTLCRAPVALVSLLDQERQWFMSKQGTDVTETARNISFCGHAILGDEPFVIEDATVDVRFADNPLVVGDPNIGFYAGVPLRMPDGLPAGTLCVLDHEARSITPDELTGLQDLAAVVEDLFVLRQLATIDPLTGLLNRRGFLNLAATILAVADREQRDVTVGYLDIDGLKRVNDDLGHERGDGLICALASVLSETFRDADAIGRLGGDEFAVLLFAAESSDSTPFDRLAAAVAVVNDDGEADAQLSVSIGCVSRPPGGMTVDQLLAAADREMYAAKRDVPTETSVR